MKLHKDFYLNENVVDVAKSLLGKYLFTNFNGGICGGYITETEAYAGVNDKASHAYNNRRTARTEIMFKEGGIAYIYLCYGMYSLFNVVSNKENIPHAVLIRGLTATEGLETIAQRLKITDLSKYKLNGPGKLSKALGIHYSQSGINLYGSTIWIEDRGLNINEENIKTTKRVGVDYAQEDANLPYRFIYNPVN